MKKTILILSSLLTLIACNRKPEFLYSWETPSHEGNMIKPPTCAMRLSAPSGYIGSTLDLTFEIHGDTTEATLDGETVEGSVVKRTLPLEFVGPHAVEGRVSNNGGFSTCRADFEIFEIPPTCTLAAFPQTAFVGDTVTATLQSTGKVNSASIEGLSVAAQGGVATLITSQSGTLVAHAKVEGPGGVATCETSYVVKDKPPTCTIAADPNPVTTSQPLTITLNTDGRVFASTINGIPVAFPLGNLVFTPDKLGQYTAMGFVKGPGGTATCSINYTVYEPPPQCTLTANPNPVNEGDNVTLTLQATGKVSSATIDGTSVSFPTGSTTEKVSTVGTVSAHGVVTGIGGTGSCDVTYMINPKPRPRPVLVLDLKSGWWGGDGGKFHDDLFTKLTTDNLKTEVEYNYIDRKATASLTAFFPPRADWVNDSEFIADKFPRRAWTDYKEIWLLSGNYDDNMDLTATDDLLKRILDGFVKNGGAFFLGAGAGNKDHANEVLKNFNFPQVFATDEPSGQTFGVGQFSVVSYLKKGAGLPNHELFNGVEQLPDTVKVPTEFASDYFTSLDANFQTLVNNTAGKPSIALCTGARKCVLDAGLPRFYVLKSTPDDPTYQYLKNILEYLSPMN